jgi:NCS1 family nucleobase:cation symporter-1
VCAKKWHSAVPDHLILPVEQDNVVQPKNSGAGRAAAQA